MKSNVLLILSILFLSNFAIAQDPVSSGLIAHYCFDGNADDAVGTKHCTVYGATLSTDRLGRTNSAYEFDGVDDYIQAPSDIWFSGDFTVSAWLYVSSYKNFAKFFDFSNGAPGDNVMYSATPTAYIGDAFIIRKNTCTPSWMEESANTTPFPLGVWVYTTIVLRGAVGEVWRNGVNVTTRSSSVMGPPCSVIRTKNYFGKSPWSHDEYFEGKMDDIRIYNRALSASEIDTLFKINQSCLQQSSVTSTIKSQDFFLSQNRPNPSDGQTQINYKTPLIAQNCSLQIIDITGKTICNYSLKPNQTGTIIISKNECNAGLYFYSLIADGKTLDRKKMLINY